MADKKYADWPEERKVRRRATLRKWYVANLERERARGREAAKKRRPAVNEYQAEWRAANPDKVKEYTRRWRTANPERIKKRDWVQSIKKRYGISDTDYEIMVALQRNRCAICERSDPGGRGRWHVDHCSKTGNVRRLLCSSCNPGLGFFKHDVILLQRAIDYLKQFE